MSNSSASETGSFILVTLISQCYRQLLETCLKSVMQKPIPTDRASRRHTIFRHGEAAPRSPPY